MPKFLLDANLSPQTARFLRRQLQVDAVSILERTMEPRKDAAIAAIARREDRVIITFDADFTRRSGQIPFGGSGVMYLRLGKDFQFVAAVNRILARFLTTQAPTIDLDHALVTITEHAVTIHAGPSMARPPAAGGSVAEPAQRVTLRRLGDRLSADYRDVAPSPRRPGLKTPG